jgi:hypothetical protein
MVNKISRDIEMRDLVGKPYRQMIVHPVLLGFKESCLSQLFVD